jgi:pentatricopeptide repeat protein
MHAEIVMRGLESDLFVGSSLIDMYSKCGFLETAEQVFNTLPNCDVVSWNALIAGFTEYGCAEEALNNFLKMQCRGFSPDDFTFSCVLKSCAKTEASEKSQELHAAIIQKGLERDLVVGSTLVGAYSKCGSSAEAHDVFTFLPVPDVVAWTALIAGHGLQLGEAEKAIHVLNEMIREGVEPNLVTFVGVLNACSNAGLITEGENCLGQIRENYGSILRAEHFTCMVDLLGRAGHLDEAIAVIKKMPFHPGAVVWQSLLGACRKWGHVEFGKLAFENAVSLDQKNVAAYVCMANIYAEDAKEDKVECFS